MKKVATYLLIGIIGLRSIIFLLALAKGNIEVFYMSGLFIGIIYTVMFLRKEKYGYIAGIIFGFVETIFAIMATSGGFSGGVFFGMSIIILALLSK